MPSDRLGAFRSAYPQQDFTREELATMYGALTELWEDVMLVTDVRGTKVISVGSLRKVMAQLLVHENNIHNQGGTT